MEPEIENPQAFPGHNYHRGEAKGMSLLDHYAGEALTGFCSRCDTNGNSPTCEKDQVATLCFDFAEAMLVERAKYN